MIPAVFPGHCEDGRIEAAKLVRPHIIQDRPARAWLHAHSGGAEFAAPLNSYSQPSAELVVLFPEASRCLCAAFFKDNFVPLQHGAAPNDTCR
jgi:hypothetical protein